MSSRYQVNANFTINVQVEVEADSEDEARSEAEVAILNKDCDWLDPIDQPAINSVCCVEWECESCGALHTGDAAEGSHFNDAVFCDQECVSDYLAKCP